MPTTTHTEWAVNWHRAGENVQIILDTAQDGQIR
jgi:hypothetical protein